MARWRRNKVLQTATAPRLTKEQLEKFVQSVIAQAEKRQQGRPGRTPGYQIVGSRRTKWGRYSVAVHFEPVRIASIGHREAEEEDEGEVKPLEPFPPEPRPPK